MFDLLIKQATVIDGTGSPGRVSDVGIRDGRFAAIASVIEACKALRTIDGSGLVLTPGFIDIHTHQDLALLTSPRSEIQLRQGVTFEVVGNCGSSIVPLVPPVRNPAQIAVLENLGLPGAAALPFTLRDYRHLLEQRGVAVNMTTLIGHGTLRLAAMGYAARRPEPDELNHMKGLLAAAMDQGAAGLSTGLIYAPGIFADTAELVELARVVAARGGFYASHMRNEAEGILDAINEVIAVGRGARIPLQISHLKITGRRNWELRERVIEKLCRAREEGLDLTCDIYPYFCSGTSLTALMPPWALEGGLERLVDRMRDPGRRRKIVRDIEQGLPGWEDMYHNAGWDRITIAHVPSETERVTEGRTIAEIARSQGMDPFDVVFSLIEKDGNGVKIISETMNEETVAEFIQLPFVMIGSDSSFSEGKPHPRLYGTFPRVIRRFVRELKVLSLEEAIHKMSGMPARRLGLRDVGVVKEGCRADAVLFDPERFSDTATYDDPCRSPVGLRAAIVNGVVVVEKDRHTGALPGVFHCRKS